MTRHLPAPINTMLQRTGWKKERYDPHSNPMTATFTRDGNRLTYRISRWNEDKRQFNWTANVRVDNQKLDRFIFALATPYSNGMHDYAKRLEQKIFTYMPF